MFNSILSNNVSTLSVVSVLICIVTAVILGIVIALVHMKTSEKYNKNFVITLALLPVLVEVVMIMVNGDLGTSVAVLGAFSLIRFRSIPGNSREITSIFFAMGIGLSLGMGQIWFAVLLTFVISLLLVLFYKTRFGDRSQKSRMLKIVIPEDLDYEEVFNDIFEEYTSKYTLEQVKTTNLGSMYELKYNVELKHNISTKEFIDTLRTRNGNMKIILSHYLNEESL